MEQPARDSGGKEQEIPRGDPGAATSLQTEAG